MNFITSLPLSESQYSVFRSFSTVFSLHSYSPFSPSLVVRRNTKHNSTRRTRKSIKSGFFRESSRQEEEVGFNQQKFNKSSTCPENFRFDFEDYSSEFGGGFSLASAEPFLDFDSIKDWIEEMQVPDSVDSNKAKMGSGVCLETDNVVDFGQEMNGSEKTVPLKVECSVSDENVDGRGGIGGGNRVMELDGMKDCSTAKAEIEEISSNGHLGETLVEDTTAGVLAGKDCHKVESLGCTIEKGLEKVNLVGDDGGVVVAGIETMKMGTLAVNEEDSDSDSDSESESETSSSSSSASSSSSESDGEEEKVKEKEAVCKIKRETTKLTLDMEEGQIMESDGDDIILRSKNNEDEREDNVAILDKYGEEFQFVDDADDDEDGGVVNGPIKSKNELEVLPPVPPVDVTLQPCDEILPVGIVSSVLGAQVVVEGSEKHDPLSEGSILWITERRLALGRVDEIFGPVKAPFYIVRYNSESEVPSGIQDGTVVGFVTQYVDHVLNDKNIYQKGYDASGENDEELSEELEFSDDEKEAEYKRQLKMSKRGKNSQGSGNKKKNRKNNQSRDLTLTKDHPSSSQSSIIRSSHPSQMQQHGSCVPPLGPSLIGPVYFGGSAVSPSGQSDQVNSSQMHPFFPNGPMVLPHQMQQAGVLLNGLFANGIPFQQQNMALSSGIQNNGMPWLQQNHPQNLQWPSVGPAPWQQQQQQQQQMPLSNPAQFQQPFGLSQLLAGATAAPLGSMNFSAGPTNAPWPGMLGQNLSNQGQPNAGFVGQNISNQTQLNPGPQAPNSQLPAMQRQSFNSQRPNNFQGNNGAFSQFNEGPSSGRGGRGRGARPFNHRGGHFGGGRGRQ